MKQKNVIVLVVALIIIVAGVYYYSAERPGIIKTENNGIQCENGYLWCENTLSCLNPNEDVCSKIVEQNNFVIPDLIKNTGIGFMFVDDSSFDWITGEGNEFLFPTNGKRYEASVISGKDLQKITDYFSHSMEENIYMMADGAQGGMTGYSSGNTACLVFHEFLKMTEDEKGILVPGSDEQKVNITCGIIGQ